MPKLVDTELKGKLMSTMDWTLHASKILIEEDGFIDLKQFKKGQILETTGEETFAWMVIDVREKWLKLLPLFNCYARDPRMHKRFNRMSIDLYFEQGWWRIGEPRR